MAQCARWLCLVAGLSIGLGLGPAGAAEVTLRLGGPWTTGSNLHKGMEKFAEHLAAASRGRYEVKVFPDSQLGDIQQLLTGVQLGTIDLAYLAIGNAAQLRGGGQLNVAYVPHLFKSKAQATEVLNGPIFTEMYEAVAKGAGVRIFAVYGARSPRAVQTVKGPVRKPEDLKGMRIRIPPIDMLRAAMEAAGAKPVPMGLSDVYMALSRGTVDGQENGFDAAIQFKWHEVAKFWSATDHVFEVGAWYMNERKWQALKPEERELFRQAARTGGQIATELGEALDREGIETLRKSGVTYVVPDSVAFGAAWADLHQAYEGKTWPAGLVEKIRASMK
jgi:tripartite ATP-independent transporter DctP family solute receptor